MKRLLRPLPRLSVYLVLSLVLLVGGAIMGLRYWLLPNIEQYRQDIAAAVSRAAGTHVSIGSIRANWDGLRPQLQMDRVQVFDAHDSPALELVRVDATLSWRSLFAGSLRLNALEIIQPTLEIKRDKTGQLFVAGVPMSEKAEGGGFGNLVLDTKSLLIRDAVLSWEDEYNGAPPLVMDGVLLMIENHGARHRFALKATPPAQLAGLIDLRGDLYGDNFVDMQAWSGRVYAELPYADAGAWRSYLPLPKTFVGGRGGIRIWLDFRGQSVGALVADVKLSDTVARLNENLPQLDLTSLSGRLRYRALGGGFEVSSEKLAFTTRGNTRVGSTDFYWRSEPGEKGRDAQGEFRANQMELAAWASLSEYLPLEQSLKQKIVELAPSGRVNDLDFKWTGDAAAPARYALNGRIERGAVKAMGNLPGLTGLSAAIDANEGNGSIAIQALAQLNLPKVFNAPLDFDRCTVSSKWKRNGTTTEVNVSEAAFANGHLAGTAAGVYQAISGQPGAINLNARLTRFDGSHITHYLPRVLGPQTQAWLERAIIQAKSTDARLRLVGNLKDFPFADGKSGEFAVNAKLTDGVLDYAPSWPRIENIRADLNFRGRGMEVRASEGSIFTTRLKDVVATIANLGAPDPLLEVRGEANGPFADGLRFINQSPVKERIGNFTDGMAGAGTGKLALKLAIPVNDSRSAKVEGDYQFLNGSFDFGGSSPSMTEVNGHLQFSEKGVRAQNVAARMLGGPMVLSVATRAEGEVAIDAGGTASADGLRAWAGQALLKQVSGTAQWQGQLNLRKAETELKLTSPLNGIASNLPPPLAKTAGQDLPLTVERRLGPGKPESLRATLGNVVFAELERSSGADGLRLKRGVVSFNKPAPLPTQDGLWIAGELRTLDIDRWREVLREQAGAGDVSVAGVDIGLGSINLFDRPFADLHVTGRADGGNWRGSLSGREVDGEFEWRPAGKGLIYGRLKRLTIPEGVTGPAASGDKEIAGTDLPALDIVADELKIKSRKLGRLELKADPQGRNWRINRLKLVQADATLEADGLWSRAAKSQTELKLQLTAPDAGQLLGELGFLGSVKRGQADLSGNLSWPGAPFDMVPANLSGHLKLVAKSGQFLKAEPGAGRLFGLMSLQSLPRRISLDFRDIFSEGFAFDEIRGDVTIRLGLMTTRDFTIKGPSAQVEMSGDVNLATETQQLTVKVIPTVGEGVSIASGFLGGPVVGVTALVLQKMLKDPINRAVAYEYKVTGTWDNPNVVKFDRKSAADEARQQ